MFNHEEHDQVTKALPRRRRRLRRFFLGSVLFLLLVALALAAFGFYLTRAGLPEFLKAPLVAKLSESGVQLEFSRMHWRWPDGIVAENAVFTLLKSKAHPKFFAREAVLDLDWHSSFGEGLPLRALTIQDATLEWPISKTNNQTLTFSNITTHLEFQANQQIELPKLEGDFAGAHLTVNGVVSNAFALRGWEIFKAKEKRRARIGSINSWRRWSKFGSRKRPI